MEEMEEMEKTKKRKVVDKLGLTSYHYRRQKEAIEGVKRMMENPLTVEQMVAQVNAIWKTEHGEKSSN
ncbi:MAG: hypothetical protein LBL94_09355 [Prevotellaceae bacterium]|jgi:hypothetical protein|nr:hypothetical protein [Prevotellaceae bacterium]